MQKENNIDQTQPILGVSVQMILKEQASVVRSFSLAALEEIETPIKEAASIFLTGAGRSGFMVKAAAMRLVHLGYSVHVVGETTTPAITENDLLISVSGSGTTTSIVKAAEIANKIGAVVVAFTTNKDSKLSTLANHLVIIPAAGKQEHDNNLSYQYAGSLFEQSFLIIFDAFIHFLWKQSNESAEEVYVRHANIE